jgi:hypothetical protein
LASRSADARSIPAFGAVVGGLAGVVAGAAPAQSKSQKQMRANLSIFARGLTGDEKVSFCLLRPHLLL